MAPTTAPQRVPAPPRTTMMRIERVTVVDATTLGTAVPITKM